jgi:hypothetical protein
MNEGTAPSFLIPSLLGHYGKEKNVLPLLGIEA